MSCPPGYTFVTSDTINFKNQFDQSIGINESNMCIGPAYANYKLDGSTGQSVLELSTSIKCPWGVPVFNGKMTTAVDTVAAVTTSGVFSQFGSASNTGGTNTVVPANGANCAGVSVLGQCIGGSANNNTIQNNNTVFNSPNNSTNVSIAKAVMPSAGLFVGEVHCQYKPNTNVVGGYDGATK